MPPFVNIVIIILVLAFAWWIFSTYVLPHVPEPFRTFLIVFLAIVAILWLLSWAGMLGSWNWGSPRALR